MGMDLSVFCFAGLESAIVPTHLAIAGSLILILLFLRSSKNETKVLFALTFLFLLIMGGLVLDLGSSATVFAIKWFSGLASRIYLMLGTIFVFVALAFLHEWRLLLIKGLDRPFAAFVVRPVVGNGCAFFMAVFLAGLLMFLSNLWPENTSVVLQGAMAFTPGRLFSSIGKIFTFEIFRNVIVLLVMVLFFAAYHCKNEKFQRVLKDEKSLISIMMAAFFLAGGMGLILFTFNAY